MYRTAPCSADKHIVRAATEALLAAGYAIEIKGRAGLLTDTESVMAASFTEGENLFYVHKDEQLCGWVQFVYGNGGWYALDDYTVNLHPVIKPVLKFAARLLRAA